MHITLRNSILNFKIQAHESPGKNKPRILPKVENFADGNVHLMLVPETLVNSRGGLDTPEDVRVNQEDSENLLRILGYKNFY